MKALRLLWTVVLRVVWVACMLAMLAICTYGMLWSFNEMTDGVYHMTNTRFEIGTDILIFVLSILSLVGLIYVCILAVINTYDDIRHYRAIREEQELKAHQYYAEKYMQDQAELWLESTGTDLDDIQYNEIPERFRRYLYDSYDELHETMVD